MNHLSAQTQKALALPDEKRIARILDPGFVAYPSFNRCSAKLEEILSYPRTPRMVSALIVGDSNTGKSTIAREFAKSHPADANVDGDTISAPVFLVQAPPSSDERRVYQVILKKIWPYRRLSSRLDQLQSEVVQTLAVCGVQVLVIDEVQHLVAGSNRQNRISLNALKYLCNELCISLALFGTPEAYNAVRSDDQVLMRCETMKIGRWQYNQHYRQLLASFEALMPLRQPSYLSTQQLAQTILNMSDGTIGEIKTIITRAGVQAVKDKTEHITLQTLDKIDYVSPARRRDFSRLPTFEQ